MITDVKMVFIIRGVCSDCGKEIVKQLPVVENALPGNMVAMFKQNSQATLGIGHVCQGTKVIGIAPKQKKEAG